MRASLSCVSHLVIVLTLLFIAPAWAVAASSPCSPKYDPDPAQRVVCLGESCNQFGNTIIDGSGENLIACLQDGGGSLKWKSMTPGPMNVVIKSKVHPFVLAANYLDCDNGYVAIACMSVVVPSGDYSCQTYPTVNPKTNKSSCVQAGCNAKNSGDTGYFSTATCAKRQ